MPTAIIASRPSISAAVGAPVVKPSTARPTTWSAPGVRLRLLEKILQRYAEEPRVADQVAADLVGDAGQRDVALDHRAGQQLRVRQRDLVLDPPVDPQRPGGRVDLRHDQRGVDPVEVVVAGHEVGLAGDRGVGRQLRCRRTAGTGSVTELRAALTLRRSPRNRPTNAEHRATDDRDQRADHQRSAVRRPSRARAVGSRQSGDQPGQSRGAGDGTDDRRQRGGHAGARAGHRRDQRRSGRTARSRRTRYADL